MTHFENGRVRTGKKRGPRGEGQNESGANSLGRAMWDEKTLRGGKRGGTDHAQLGSPLIDVRKRKGKGGGRKGGAMTARGKMGKRWKKKKKKN